MSIVTKKKKGRDKLKLLIMCTKRTKSKKKREKKDELSLFQRESIDNMIEHSKADVIDKQLCWQNEGMSDKNLLLIENKRTKYLVKTLKIF